MKTKNLEALRALKAFEFANQGNKKQNTQFNYSAAVQGLPSMIRMNGLRATMAYYYKKEGAHKEIFNQLSNWFKDADEPTKIMSNKLNANTLEKPDKLFMQILLELNDDEYRIVQSETLTLANWMIRFVKS